jgi:acetate kinase
MTQSQVKIMVVPTNEERAIALQTLQLLQTEG